MVLMEKLLFFYVVGIVVCSVVFYSSNVISKMFMFYDLINLWIFILFFWIEIIVCRSVFYCVWCVCYGW